MWILRFFGQHHEVLWKYGMVWCQNWYACHVGQIVNSMCWTKVLMKNLKFGALMYKLNFACWIMKKHVSIQHELTFMSFDEKSKRKPEWVYRSHEKFNDWFFLKFDEMCFELMWKVVKWIEKLSIETWKCFSRENFGFRIKTDLNWC